MEWCSCLWSCRKEVPGLENLEIGCKFGATPWPCRSRNWWSRSLEIHVSKKLWRAFQNEGAQTFSVSQWLFFHTGSNKTRFQCCTRSNNVLLYIRVIQGAHRRRVYRAWIDESCRNSTQMEKIPVSCRKLFLRDNSILQAGLIAGGKDTKRRATDILHSLRPFWGRRRMQSRFIEAEKSAPEQMEGFSGRPLDQFGQGTRERITILADRVWRHSPLRFSASRLHCKNGMPSRTKLYRRIPTPRAAKTHFKLISEFKELILHNEVLEDEGRVTQILESSSELNIERN